MKTFLALALACGLAVPAVAQDMVGVSWSGSVYSLNSATGAGSLIGASGFSSINNMAKSPTGKLIVAAGYGIPCTMVEINPTTGAGTAIVTTTLNSIRGMSYLGNTLYAINDSSGTGFGIDDLYSIDLGTGAATFLGSTGYYGVQGLGAANGKLYAWEIGSGNCSGAGLIEINPANGAATDVNPAQGNQICDVQALCSSPSGTMYAVQNSVYTVDLNTGVLTLVGAGGYSDLRGAEFTGGGPPSFTLAKSGSCPGPVTLTTTNGTPSNAVAIVYGNAGSWTKPSGTCAGLTLGIASPNLGAIVGSNGSGSASISFNAQAAWCGKTVQAVDVATCTASNTITL